MLSPRWQPFLFLRCPSQLLTHLIYKRINIAIDGFSACGKSTLARDLASALDYRHIDSGAMYRAITYFFLTNNCSYQDPEQVDRFLDQIDLDFQIIDNQSVLFLNGEPQGENLRLPKVDQKVSEIAALSAVRKKVVAQQQWIGREKGVVMDGRDIGTVVFPDARVKIFLTADLDTRISRRVDELAAKGVHLDLKVVAANLKKRDHIDSTRKHSPLSKAVDAVTIDNTNLTQVEQLEMVLALARHRISEIVKNTSDHQDQRG